MSVTLPPHEGPPASKESAPPPSHPNRGPLIAIGGAEDKVGDRATLRHVVDRAGGKSARIAIARIVPRVLWIGQPPRHPTSCSVEGELRARVRSGDVEPL